MQPQGVWKFKIHEEIAREHEWGLSCTLYIVAKFNLFVGIRNSCGLRRMDIPANVDFVEAGELGEDVQFGGGGIGEIDEGLAVVSEF